VGRGVQSHSGLAEHRRGRCFKVVAAESDDEENSSANNWCILVVLILPLHVKGTSTTNISLDSIAFAIRMAKQGIRYP
jgi:hypothetical protein